MRRLTHLVRNLLHTRQIEAQLDDELHAYLDLLEEEKIRSSARRYAWCVSERWPGG